MADEIHQQREAMAAHEAAVADYRSERKRSQRPSVFPKRERPRSPLKLGFVGKGMGIFGLLYVVTAIHNLWPTNGTASASESSLSQTPVASSTPPRPSSQQPPLYGFTPAERAPLAPTAAARKFAALHASAPLINKLIVEAHAFTVACNAGDLSCLNLRDEFVAEYTAALVGSPLGAWEVAALMEDGTGAGVRPDELLACAWYLVNHHEGGASSQWHVSQMKTAACSSFPQAVQAARLLEDRIAALTASANG